MSNIPSEVFDEYISLSFLSVLQFYEDMYCGNIIDHSLVQHACEADTMAQAVGQRLMVPAGHMFSFSSQI